MGVVEMKLFRPYRAVEFLGVPFLGLRSLRFRQPRLSHDRPSALTDQSAKNITTGQREPPRAESPQCDSPG
jgi:hypothetical protein